MICQKCQYEFPDESERCPECGEFVPEPKPRRKTAMTWAEVEAEDKRFASALRDAPTAALGWQSVVWLLVFIATLTLWGLLLLPDWVGCMAIVANLIPVGIVIPRRFRAYAKFERLREEAAKVNYLMCPDCAHQLSGCVVAAGEVVCPECGRRVLAGDLREIWTGKA